LSYELSEIVKQMKKRNPSIECSCLVLAAIFFASISSTASGISLGQVDDFQDGSTQHWGISLLPENIADAGPDGVGDNALLITAHGGHGPGGRLLTATDGFQWDGNWTSAGVTQIAIDVRNPNQYPLMMRIGIAGPDGIGGAGFGDAHVSTNPITVPADDAWHSITFPATAADFTSTSTSTNIAAALAGVSQFRVLHNPEISFLGETVSGSFYMDNIRALAAAAPPTGDYNGNGTVDAADYVVWRSTVNESVTPGTGADATGPGGTPDGIVDQLDYNFWRSRFGAPAPGRGALGTISVPEPASCYVFFTVVVALYRRNLSSRLGA
jgi:hypothetical protein